jgi:FixJ family two-component response regulator
MVAYRTTKGVMKFKEKPFSPSNLVDVIKMVFAKVTREDCD